MSVDRNARTGHHLLGPNRNICATSGRACFYENVAVVTKVNQMFAFVWAEYKSLRRGDLPVANALQ
jgi:hypothetical protein